MGLHRSGSSPPPVSPPNTAPCRHNKSVWLVHLWQAVTKSAYPVDIAGRFLVTVLAFLPYFVAWLLSVQEPGSPASINVISSIPPGIPCFLLGLPLASCCCSCQRRRVAACCCSASSFFFSSSCLSAAAAAAGVFLLLLWQLCPFGPD